MIKKSFTFIGYWPDYEELFIKQAKTDNIAIEIINPRHIWKNKNSSVYLRLFNKPFRANQEKKIIQQNLSQNNSTTFILSDSYAPLDVLCRHSEKINAHILMRNTLKPNSDVGQLVLKAAKIGYPIWSFDPNDCRKYDFHHYNQFIEKLPEIENTPIKYDLLFIGLDKDRLPLLKSIQNLAQKANLSCQLDIRSRNKRNANHHLSYSDYLKIQCSSKCIIDIVKQGQTGLTLRPLEAAMYQRKLLTNNASVLELSFYQKNNILFFNDIAELDIHCLQEFLSQPMQPINPKLLEPFRLTSLLAQISQY